MRSGCQTPIYVAPCVGAVRQRHGGLYKGPMKKAIGAKPVRMTEGPVLTWSDAVPEGLPQDSPMTVEMGNPLQERMMLDWKTEFLPKTVHIESLPENYFDRAISTAKTVADLEGVMRTANETTIFDPDYFHARMPRERRTWANLFSFHRLLMQNPNLPNYFVRDICMHPGVAFRFLWTRHGRNVQTNGEAPFLLTSRHGLAPVLSPEEVSTMSEAHSFRESDPISPFYGVDRADFGEKRIEYGINPRSLLQYPHTLVLTQDQRSMGDEGHVANCMELAMFQFGILGAFAVNRLGYRVGHDTPMPLTMQGMYFDGRSCLFSCFQLNTLDLDSDGGTKNFFWSQKAKSLFPYVEHTKHHQYPMTKVYEDPIHQYYSFFLNYDWAKVRES